MVKLQIAAGKATPAPPVGTALGPQGVNIMDFCKNFNAKTAKDEGLIIPVVVTVYADRSYSFITKTPPAAVLLKRAARSKRKPRRPAPTWWAARRWSRRFKAASWTSMPSSRLRT